MRAQKWSVFDEVTKVFQFNLQVLWPLSHLIIAYKDVIKHLLGSVFQGRRSGAYCGIACIALFD